LNARVELVDGASGGIGTLVRYDDRLLTVLNQPAGDRHDVAVRWRQLVDLIARAGPNSANPMVARAIEEIRLDAAAVGEDLRAAAARAVAALPLPLGLLEYFASDSLAVSAPVLAAATLDTAQWRALLETTDVETRRFIQSLHPELKPEALLDLTDSLVERPKRPAEPTPDLVRAPEPTAQGQSTASPAPSLHDVVERIERRRRGRAQRREDPTSREVAADLTGLFRWECGPTGEIAWVEGAPRGPLIGRSIARAAEGDGDRIDAQVVRAFTMRAPFRDAALTVGGEGPVAGDWKISGVPAFEPADGRFAGYRGVALREAPSGAEDAPAIDLLPDPDSLRELVHEIKTPLNAIIGFAEIIDGQYLGPADRRYRNRASEIVAQARTLLMAIDDLDFAAKAHSAPGQPGYQASLDELVERMAPSLRDMAHARGVELDISQVTGSLTVSVAPELADRLIFRICSLAIEHAERGERLRLSIDQAPGYYRLSMNRPAALAGLTDAQLFGSSDHTDAQAFCLRLVRGLARIAGVELVTLPDACVLSFPRA
jgi:hypothetical protein